MYRQILKHLLVEVKENEEYPTPQWLKPILNNIPAFGLDGRRKDFFGLTYRCKNCLFFFGDQRKRWHHQSKCQQKPVESFLNTRDNLPCITTNRDVELTSVVQFRHAVRMCPYPTNGQFLFASLHPDEDNSNALRTSYEDKRDVENWRLYHGAQQAQLNPYRGLNVPCPLREQEQLNTLTDIERVDTVSTHHTIQPNTAPAKENIRIVKLNSVDDFDD